MQKIASKRSVSKFEIISNLSTKLRDTSQKSTANASFNMCNTIQNDEVSLVWRHLETLWRHFRETFQRNFRDNWRHFTMQQLSAKCLQSLSLDFSVSEIWRHFVCQRSLKRFAGRSTNFEVSLSVSRVPNLSLRSVSEVSLNLVNFCQVSLEREVLSWQF